MNRTTMATPLLSLHNTAWLVLALGLIAAPHAERLPAWVTLLAAVLALWRLHLGRMRLALPRRWVLLVVVAGAAAAVFMSYRTIFGRDAGVALLVVMLALKLLETRSRRDALLLVFLGYFLIVTHFLYSQTIPTALYTLGCVWIITATMIGCNRTQPPARYTEELRAAGLMLAQAAPLMLVLFLFFPRTTGPLWGLPHDAHTGVTGLSDSMSPGTITSLSLSDAVAFRVEFKDAILPESRRMYWRGPVLWDLHGATWNVGRYSFRPPQVEALSPPIGYTVTLEPHNKPWLFALDLPGQVPPRAKASGDLQLLATAPVNKRARYDMVSYLQARFGVDEDAYALQRALRLPPASNPRTVAFARNLRQKFPDDRALIQEVLLMFRGEEFYYTLQPPPLGEHTADDFLFRTRSGFCEHYASAFAVLMRAAGIPARIVTGYQGGQLNPFGRYLIVRQADAHAWTEVWLRDEGWVRIDPTAAVSPLRIESGIAAAVPRAEALPLLARGDYPWLRQLRFTWDSLANHWNQWVLGFDPERQRWMLSRVGIDEATWRTLSIVLIVATGFIMLALLPLMLRALREKVDDPAKRAYLRFCTKLERKGLPRTTAEGPSAYAARLSQLRPDLAPKVSAITQLYIGLRYGPDPGSAALRDLEFRVRQFSA